MRVRENAERDGAKYAHVRFILSLRSFSVFPPLHHIDCPQKRPPAMKIAIVTSGGDSAGMNAAVRSIVKTGILR